MLARSAAEQQQSDEGVWCCIRWQTVKAITARSGWPQINSAFLPHHEVNIRLLASEARKPDFLAKNPNGRVPLLEYQIARPEQTLAPFFPTLGERDTSWPR